MAHALVYKKTKMFLALSVFMLVALPAIASPANGEHNDPPPFTRSETYKYTIRDDGLMDSVQTVELFVGNEQAASAAAQQSIEFSSYYTDVHIAEAAIIKADGRLLPIPANSIVFRGKPASLLETSYSLDAKVAEVGFPDIAPGDRIRYTVVNRALREMVPGGYGYFAFSVDPVERYSSVKVSLDAPVDRKLHTAETGFNHKVLNVEGRVQHEWTLTRPLAYRAAEANAVAPEDGAAFMAFSTYPDWHAVGYGFSSRAEPMAAVTPEIASLAAQITQGKTGVREQAQAIYAWVTSNIRYVSIVLGAGGLVPRSAASIIANRYGDCKDHVTLMRALLTARGITSEYALINVGRSIYKTFSIPLLLFDHVIVYIPELNLYVDPTAKNAPFAALPDYLADKVVLRSGGAAVTLARVPPVSAESNTIAVETQIDVAPDGSAGGSNRFAASASSYAIAKALSEAMRTNPNYMRTQLSALNRHGNAEITGQSFDDARGVASLDIALTLNDNILGRDNGSPVLMTPGVAEPFRAFGTTLFRADRVRDFVCVPVSFRHTASYRLPARWRPEALPQDLNRKAGPAEFTARYRWSGNTLKAERAFILRTAASVCPASLAREIAPVYNAAIRNAEQRLTFILEKEQDEISLTGPVAQQRDAARSDTPPFSTSGHLAMTLRPDYRRDTTTTIKSVIHTRAGVERLTQFPLSVSENEDVIILEAATLKADGRTLNVPPDNILSFAIRGLGGRRVILFPGLEPGDRIRASWRSVEKEPAIPGGFAVEPVLATGDPFFSDLRVTLDAPAEMNLRIAAQGFEQEVATSNGHTHYEWRMIPTPFKRKDGDLLSAVTPVARLKISSFADWRAAGRALCEPAAKAAAVTPEITQLSRQITAGRTSRLDQAKAIFDWLDHNVTESVIPKAILIPSAASSTLSARQGGSDDVAVLMQALLNAAGIEAHLARNDSQRTTGELDIPDPSAGTAIVYLPEFDLYADPAPGSNSEVAFGIQHEMRYGRQTLRCGPGTPELTRMPAATAEANAMQINADISVSADGLASGTATSSASGVYKTEVRAMRKSFQGTNPTVEFEKQMQNQGLSGSARLLPPSPKEDADSTLRTEFTVNGSVLGEDNAQAAIVGPRLLTRPFRIYAATLHPDRSDAFVCFPRAFQENITYHLPAGWKAVALPGDITRRSGPAEFSARYKWQPGRLDIERRFVLYSTETICPPTLAKELLPVVKAAEQDASARLTFVAADE